MKVWFSMVLSRHRAVGIAVLWSRGIGSAVV